MTEHDEHDEYDDRAARALRDALAARGDSLEPRALDPVSAMGSPGRWRWVAAAAAVVLVAGGTAYGVWTLRDDDAGPAPVDIATDGPTPGGDLRAAPGWRFESIRDVVVQVPDSWDYGWAPRSDWCVDDDGREQAPADPLVDIPGGRGLVRSIACVAGKASPVSPEGVPERLWRTHLALQPSAYLHEQRDGTYTDGGWTRVVRTVGDARLALVYDEAHAAEARQVLDSVRTVRVRNPDGCALSSPIQANRIARPPARFDVGTMADVDSVAVCQYDLGVLHPRPGLVASRVLEGADADALLAAIRAAPAGGGSDTPATCVKDMYGDDAVVLRLSSGDTTHEMFVHYSWCRGNGFDDGTTKRRLTPESCVPLWGGRVVSLSGSSAPAQACRPEFGSGASKP